MVNFVKPSYLGSEKEFRERFEMKIRKGQEQDASYYDKRVMRNKTYILHKVFKKIEFYPLEIELTYNLICFC